MRIISFAAIKGGVGKTTLAFNFGEWLAHHGQKVLLIDLDHQCNLTQTYNIYQEENTVANIFRGEGGVEIIPVKENLHVLPGYMQLDSVEKDLENKVNKDMLLYMWLEDHYEDKELKQYDFIIIDCHPDFSTATRNAIAVSHAIVSLIIPSEHGYNAKFNLEDRLAVYRQEVVDYRTRESFITAKLFFLPNMIKHNTQSSKNLLEVLNASDDSQLLKVDGQVLYVPEKELFNKSTLERVSISEMKEDQTLYSRHRAFFDELEKTFSLICDTI